MKRHAVALATAALAVAGCKDSTGVPDLNNPSVESVGGALTKSNLQTLITGIVDQERRSLDYPFFVFPATMSRDVIRLDNSESRFEQETLELAPSPGGFLARGFAPYYTAIRAENNLLAAIPRATSEISAGDKAAVTGFVRTLKAHDFYRVFETRGDQGLPIAVDDPTVIAPIVCTPKVLDYLSSLLDSAYTDLQAAKAGGTTTFPVTLPSGFTSIGGDYSSIDNLIKYNRGLKGKVDLYRGIGGNAGAYTTAIAALDLALGNTANATGLPIAGVTAADLAAGPYYQFSTLSGEFVNPLADPRIHFQPSVFDSLQAGDKRASKIVVQSTPARLTVDGYTFSSIYDPAVSVASNPANTTRPIPILKNEELYLVRAQAEIGAGQLGKATSDINTVRTISGGLAALPILGSQAAAIDAVLYEKRYSLLTDGPQRLVDLRAYGRLNATTFPAGSGTTRSQLSPYAGDPFNKQLPFPQSEIDARGGNVTCQ